MDDFFEKLGKTILTIVIVVVAIFIIITVSNIALFSSVFGWLQNKVHVITGWDYNLAKAVAAIFMAILVIMPIGAIIKAFTPIPQQNRGKHLAIVCLIISGFSLFTYISSQDTYFNPKTGQPMKYYSIRNGEYHFFSTPGYDPITGDKLKPVDRETAIKSKGLDVKPVYTPPPKPKPAQLPTSPQNNVSLPIKSKQSYAAPQQYDPIINPPNEELIRNQRKPEIKEERIDSPTKSEVKKIMAYRIYINNTSQSTWLIKDSRGRLIDDCRPLQCILIKLEPGKYYLENASNLETESFSVDYRSDGKRFNLISRSQSINTQRRIYHTNKYYR